MKAPNLNQLWANLIIEEMIRAGVGHFVVAPGSRSAPLAAAAFRNPRAAVQVHFDERGAAFMALGCGRAGKPAAVICTSGSAVANCLPAVVEAKSSALPLAVLSADRPPELQSCGANQTMEQPRLFGRFVFAEESLPCPDLAVPPEALLTKVDALMAQCCVVGRGPVHMNCMFREPLAPIQVDVPGIDGYVEGLDGWSRGALPYARWMSPNVGLSMEQVRDLASRLAGVRHGLLLIGRLHCEEERAASLALAEVLGWPVFADVASGCRPAVPLKNGVPHYDLLLRSERFREACAPECVLHLGDAFVSKRLQERLAWVRPEYIHVSPRSENRDPLHRATRRYQADIVEICRLLTAALSRREDEPAYLAPYVKAEACAREYMAARLDDCAAWDELHIAGRVGACMKAEETLYLGNSMPVRDMDMALHGCAAADIHANRGVSGIDGNIATAAGMAWASGRPVTAVVGDVAALHDMNSLSLLSRLDAPVTLVIVNNGGGGIFSFLPIAEHQDLFGPCFVNPHAYGFEQLAAMFGLHWEKASSAAEFEAALAAGAVSRGSRVIEARVDREVNVSAHQACWAELAALTDARLTS